MTWTELKNIINDLPNKHSSGSDNVDNILLKELKDLIVPSLCLLFNRSLQESCFPDRMKLAEVIPLHKGKEKSLPTNYRPISLLLTLSKLLEKVVYKRTYNFLNSTHQIYNSQYGFRSNHSCEHAIQELIGKIVKGKENNHYTLALFLDLSKAFDTISHSVLFKKLEIYGVRGSCLSWFKSYLDNRKMRTKCVGNDGNIYFSSDHIVNVGTPQGSVLGPLIFLLFNNDLHLHLTYCSAILFADDTTIYHTHRNLRHLLRCISIDLENIKE